MRIVLKNYKMLFKENILLKCYSRFLSAFAFPSEADIRRCSVKRSFKKIWQIHRETPVPESLF